ncbi:MAG: hypothetical protein H6833_07380 [Planctomycetes bacterium]|nr:hypothetical protein [Planctomycetota bacterium]
MEWLQMHQEAIEVVFGGASFLTLVVVIALNFKANQTAQHGIEQTQTMRDAELRPYVYFQILLEGPHSIASFALVNKGRHSARNVKLTLDQTLYVQRGRDEAKPAVEHMALLQKVSLIQPGGELKEFAAFGHKFFKYDNPEHVTGKITYEDVGGRQFETPVRINLKALGRRRSIVPTDFESVVDTLERIEQRLRMKR